MKPVITSFILTVMALLATSCTHNDGDIGPLFGTWHVEDIEADGTPLAGYQGNLFIAFQNSVVNLRVVDEQHHSYTDAWGNWQLTGDQLTITLPDNWYPPQDVTALGTSNVLKVERLGSKTLVVSFTSPVDGSARRFTCCKQH